MDKLFLVYYFYSQFLGSIKLTPRVLADDHVVGIFGNRGNKVSAVFHNRAFGFFAGHGFKVNEVLNMYFATG